MRLINYLEDLIFLLPPELRDFFLPLIPYLNISFAWRITILIIGILICLFLLYYLLAKKIKSIPHSYEQSFFQLISQYNLDYAIGNLIRTVLAPNKNYIKFLEDNKFFEKKLEKYQETQELTKEEERRVSKLREKLNFHTLNSSIPFYKTQQMHLGTVLKIFIPVKEGKFSFDAKVLENYESYFLISYPQSKKENYNLLKNYKIDIEAQLQNEIYKFQVHTMIEKENEKGIALMHTSKIKKIL